MKNRTDEFEELILDYLKGSSTPEDIQKLGRLLEEEYSCREMYHDLTHAYALASASWFERRRRRNLEQLRNTLNFRSSSKQTLYRRIRIWSSVAIFTLLIGLGSYFLYLYHTPRPMPMATSYCQIKTPRGNTSKLLLPDGTVVFLDGSTTLKYDASLQHKAKREVFLTGEAYFEVASNPDKPFIVHTGELNTRVLGTVFNVTAYPGNPDIKVSLAKGSVKVSITSEAQQEVILAPNEQAVYNKTHKQLSIRKIDAAAQSAWATGRLVFANERLYDILKRIEKRYDTQILIRSQKIYNEYYSGSIDSSLTLGEILSYIDVDNKFTWQKKGNTIVITDR